MILSEISIKRPICAIVLSLLLLIYGAISFLYLPVRELPDITVPSISISTTYQGASPEVIETRITKTIEDELSGISGIKQIISNSRSGKSWINVEFKQGKDMLEALSDVRDGVARLSKYLPKDADDPVVTRDNGEEDVVLWLNLVSSNMDRVTLSDYANRYIIKKLSIVDGVSQVKTVGALEKVMYISLIPAKMSALGITVGDISKAIGYENIELPSGEIRNKDLLLPVEVKRVYVDVKTFELLPIKHNGFDGTIRLRDVAKVEFKAKNEESVYHRNGVSGIGLGIIPQSNANPLVVSEKIQDEVKELRKFLPEGVKLEVDFDSTLYIKSSIFEVYSTLLITTILVILVLYFFIGSWHVTLIPALTVPISLIASFIGATIFGFSINIITLLSLILAIGLVVDDAIVMVENISHHIEKGEGVLAACFLGAKEVGFAIIATTLVLIMIFIPLMFIRGITGRMFIEFAIFLSLAVFFSSVIALTLTPALAGIFLHKDPDKKGFLVRIFEVIIAKFENFYEVILKVFLKHLYLYPIIFIAICSAIYLFYINIPHQFIPQEDRGVVYIYAIGEEGSSIYRMKRNMQILEDKLLPMLGKGEIKSMSFSTPALGQGSDQSGFVVLQLEDPKLRTISSKKLIAKLKKMLADIPDLRVHIYEPGLNGKTSSPIKYVIKGTSYQTLNEVSNKLLNEARNAGIIINANTNYSEKTPEIEVNINIDKAASLGISLIDASNVLQTALGGAKKTTFTYNGEEYDVYIRANEQEFTDLNKLSQLYIRTQEGKMVSLVSIADFRIKARAKRLPHYDRLKAITISAYTGENVSLADALNWMDNWSQKNLYSDMSVDLTGDSKTFRESENDSLFSFILAIIVVYLVLSAQFESFIHPIVVMITIPLGICGGLIGLWVLNISLNIYSQIGLLLLIGMVTKNGILIVEFANQLRGKGQSAYDAVINAATRRFKPILMTSLTAIIGALPLIYSEGPGFESRESIGAVVFFGMTISTFITLGILPGFYLFFSSFTKRQNERLEQLEKELKEVSSK